MTETTENDDTTTRSRTRRGLIGGVALLGAGAAGTLIGSGAANTGIFFDNGPDQLFGIFSVGQALPEDIDIADLSTRPPGEAISTIQFDLVNQAAEERTFDVQVSLTGDATAPTDTEVTLTADSGTLEQVGDEWPFIADVAIAADDQVSIELEYDTVFSPNEYDDIEITVEER